MPVSLKQLAWANASHQPFAEKWNAQYKSTGLEKRPPRKKRSPNTSARSIAK